MEARFFTDEARIVYVKRLTYVLEGAPQTFIRDGKLWYPEAHTISENIGIRTNTPGIVVRRVLSKISPRNYWERSIEGTENLIKFGPDGPWCGTTRAFARDAWKMILDHNLHLFGPHSPKTHHFFHNINTPDDGSHVTIDRHAVSLLGLPFKPNLKGPNGRLTNRQYYWIADIYFEVAAIFGWLANEAQAIAWLLKRAGMIPDWDKMGELVLEVAA